MDHKIIKQIFSHFNLGEPASVQKINIGFSNDVYSIDNADVFKVCKATEDDVNLEKETFLCNALKDKVPAPEVVIFDTSRKLYDRYFIIWMHDWLYIQWSIA